METDVLPLRASDLSPETTLEDGGEVLTIKESHLGRAALIDPGGPAAGHRLTLNEDTDPK